MYMSMHATRLRYNSTLPPKLPIHFLSGSSQSLTGPCPIVSMQTSRHPRQLRLNVSNPESKIPMIEDQGIIPCSAFAFAAAVYSHQLLFPNQPRGVRRTALASNCILCSNSAAWVSAYICLKCSTAASDSDIRCNVLKRATTSER
jgi:hypothetical protein